MPHLRIDTLRELVAAVGKQQTAYWRFFPAFADRLEKEFGEYLGDPSCVALSSASGPFTFDRGSYRHEGLGFEGGKFRVPLMVRLRNLNDEGDLLVRVCLYFIMDGASLTVDLKGEPTLTVSTSDLAPLFGYIYRYLENSFSNSAWFAENSSDYQGTRIGFQSPE